MAITATMEKIYSYSRLSLFEDCERAFFHKYIEGRPEPSGLPAIVGKIFHSAMEKVINEGYTPEEAVYFAVYEQNGLPEGEKISFLIAMVNRAFYRIQRLNDEYSDLLSELHLVVEVDGGRKLQGYLDIVIDDPANDEVSINDFKTSWQPFSAEDSKQLKLYAWMFEKMRGGFVAGTYKGRLIFPRCGDDAESEVVFTREEMDQAYQWANNTMDRIESKDPTSLEDWRMTTNRSKCEYCSRSTLCSGGFLEGLPGDGIPKDDVEASMIGDYVRMQELAIKRMKDGLKQHAKDSGPINVSGGRWDFVQSEPTPKISFPVLQQFAEDHQLDVEEVVTTDSKILKKWIEGDSTGFLKAQAAWTTPRSTFKFLEDEETKKPKKSKSKGGKTNE
jgi:RecB family exonuclease